MRSKAMARLAYACVLAVTGIEGAAASATLAVRPMFPPDSVWNVAVDQLPVDEVAHDPRTAGVVRLHFGLDATLLRSSQIASVS